METPKYPGAFLVTVQRYAVQDFFLSRPEDCRRHPTWCFVVFGSNKQNSTLDFQGTKFVFVLAKPRFREGDPTVSQRHAVPPAITARSDLIGHRKGRLLRASGPCRVGGRGREREGEREEREERRSGKQYKRRTLLLPSTRSQWAAVVARALCDKR
eukprot:3899231-Rhodomonas_salina.1